MAIGAKVCCPNCGVAAVHAESESCEYCGAPMDGSQPQGASVGRGFESEADLPARPSPAATDAVVRRYADAYLVARSTVGIGQLIKVLAIVLGLLVAFAGFFVAPDSRNLYVSFVLAVIVAVPLYVLGVLVAAVGQMLKANLDTAVNTSPFLSRDDMRRAMSIG